MHYTILHVSLVLNLIGPIPYTYYYEQSHSPCIPWLYGHAEFYGTPAMKKVILRKAVLNGMQGHQHAEALPISPVQLK